ANGNLKTAPTPYLLTNVTYDARNLPLSVTTSSGTSNYRYDDAGQRIAKQSPNGNSEYYLLEGGATIAVVTLNGTPSSYFNVLSEDHVIGRQVVGGSRMYYYVDILGSTRAVALSNTGSVIESYDFEPWGLRMPGRSLTAPNSTKEGFSAKEQDIETGLAYFGARYYM